MKRLQNALNRNGQSIPGIPLDESEDLAKRASLSASSTLALRDISRSDEWLSLKYPTAQLLPLSAETQLTATTTVRVRSTTILRVALRTSEKNFNYTPDVTLEEIEHVLEPGTHEITTAFTKTLGEDQYAFLCFYADEEVEILTSDELFTGIVSVQKKFNKAVSNDGEQIPPEGIGIDRFEFWVPNRRPEGRNLALTFEPALPVYSLDLLQNGYTKPWICTNAWAADLSDQNPKLTLGWDQPETINEIVLYFDTDYDHAMETSQWGHPENVMPQVVRRYRILDAAGKVLHSREDDHQTINRISLPEGIKTDRFTIELEHPSENVPAALFKVSCYSLRE